MGCIATKSVNLNADKQLLDYLTEKEVSLVKMSWKQMDDALPEAGLAVFNRFFISHNELKKLFHRLMVSTDEGYEIDMEKLRTHGTVVMQGLGAAIESLEDSVFLSNILIAVGDRHAKYNVKPDMIILLWPSIRDIMKERLGNNFTEESEMAWKHVFDYIASKIAEGIIRSKEHESLGS